MTQNYFFKFVEVMKIDAMSTPEKNIQKPVITFVSFKSACLRFETFEGCIMILRLNLEFDS